MRNQLAICIGINNYQNGGLPKLDGAINDARCMEEKLENLNFKVWSYYDLDTKEFDSLLSKLETELQNTYYTTILVYFAGHGFELNGENLLLTTDTNIHVDKRQLARYTMRLKDVLNTIDTKTNDEHSPKNKIVILDCCRMEFEHARGISIRAFAPIDVSSGTFIAYSTSKGNIASEENGHGIYTKALLDLIDSPNMEIEKMFKKVRQRVLEKTDKRQVPWEHSSLVGEYYFNKNRLDSFLFYSKNALAYKDFVFPYNSPSYEPSKLLKSNDFYFQRNAIPLLRNIDYNTVTVDEIFVLGRLLYEAYCNNCYNVIDFIQNLHTYNILNLNLNVKNHLMCGIAYQIYFDENGFRRNKLRYKDDSHLAVISLLNLPIYRQCRDFILSELGKRETNAFIIMPSSEEKLYFQIKLRISSYKILNVQCAEIYKIYYCGNNILFDENGNELTDTFDEINLVNLNKLKKEIAYAIGTQIDNVIIEGYRDEYKLVLPCYFMLLNK